MDTIKLISNDGATFDVKRSIAKTCGTIKDMIEDCSDIDELPLPNVDGHTLTLVVKYLNYHNEHPLTEEQLDDRRTDNICQWDQDFCKMDHAPLFELIKAANYLSHKNLLDVTCKTVANMIKGNTPSEIREMFKVKDDLTEEEKDKISKENAWCEDAMETDPVETAA